MADLTDSVTVRDYRAQDLEACLGVFDSNVPRYFTEEERGEYVAFLHDLPGPYLVCLGASGTVVGCGGYAFRAAAHVADLCWGMVRRDLHGRGLGRVLATTRIDRAAKDTRASAIILDTSQLTAGFYQRLGFEITSVEPDGYAVGLDRCHLRLALDRLA